MNSFSADDVIKLMTAAKQLGVQTVRVGEVAFDFAANSLTPNMVPLRTHAAEPQYASPFDDPDMWLHTKAP